MTTARNVILFKETEKYEYKGIEVRTWNNGTVTRTYFLEKWNADHSVPIEDALMEKREYKSRNALSNRMRKI